MSWRQELARRDSLKPADDVRDMIGALDWAGREELRAWLITRQTAPRVKDPSETETLQEIKVLLPWIPEPERRCLVRVARAMAERRK